VSSIHGSLPSNWTAVGNQSAAAGPLAAAARAWLGDYEQPVLRIVERAGPAASTWLEARLESFAETNNLTEVHLANVERRICRHRAVYCRQVLLSIVRGLRCPMTLVDPTCTGGR